VFNIATSFASGEEVVGVIFDGKKGKRVDDAPAEGSKSKEPAKKQKRGKKARSLTVTRMRRDATRMMTRPSQSTPLARALEGPLEARACSMTC
jgi:hypothetical protein